jgi:hypothetical protein
MLGVALALDMDLGRRALDLGGVIGGQLDVRRAEVLLQPMQLCGARNRYDPGLLQPGERDLRGRRLLLACDALERSTSAWFFSIASGVKRGSMFRKSPSPSLVSLDIAPVKKPLPSGL